MLSVATVCALQLVRPTVKHRHLLYPEAYVFKPIKNVLATGSTSPIPPPANHGDPGTMHAIPPKNSVHLFGISDEVFTAVVKKKRHHNLGLYESKSTIIGWDQELFKPSCNILET